MHADRTKPILPRCAGGIVIAGELIEPNIYQCAELGVLQLLVWYDIQVYSMVQQFEFPVSPGSCTQDLV